MKKDKKESKKQLEILVSKYQDLVTENKVIRNMISKLYDRVGEIQKEENEIIMKCDEIHRNE